MKALVFHGSGRKSWKGKSKPTIMKSMDAVVKILMTKICGTNLHIVKGDPTYVTGSRIIKHKCAGSSN